MKSSSLVLTTVRLWIFLILTVTPMPGQQPARPIDSITVDTDLVVTWAQITRREDGVPITGLSMDDFILREQGKQQHISLVTQDQPLSIVFLVDGMACLYPPELEFQRAREALRQLGDDAEIALMAWDSEVILMRQLTKDRDAIIDRLQDKVSFFHALNGPAKVVRTTRDLYRPGEAIYQAAAYLKKAASPGRRKIIITLVYSWRPPVGPLANTHRHPATEVSELLEKTGTTVYGLYLTTRRSHDGSLPLIGGFGPKTRSRLSGGSLEKFVEQTGGHILEGKREQPDDWLIRLTGLIRSAYSIGYYPDDKDFNGRFRKIKLELSVQGKTKIGAVNIKTRFGYLAIRPRSLILSGSSPARTQP